MKTLITLIKREWWEWKTSVYGLFGVIAFLGILFLIPIWRFSSGHFEHLNLNMNYQDGVLEMKVDDDEKIKLYNDADSLKIITKSGLHIDTETHKLDVTIITIAGFLLIIAFSGFQILLTLLSLFYFSDSIYKERSNNSTYYFRSLPVNDHLILSSKYISGFIGIILITSVFMIFFNGYANLVLISLDNNLHSFISPYISRIEFLDYLYDVSVFQLVSLIWFSPIIFFLVFVSALVKKRPLVIGVVGPILAMLAIFTFMGKNELSNLTYDLTWKQVFMMLGDIVNMQEEQLKLVKEHVSSNFSYDESVEIYGSFNGYLFTMRTLGSLIVSAILYICTWQAYRKNFPTG